MAGPDVARTLGGVLGGTVRDLRRLSGGASRITSAFDLEATDGSRRPLILQQTRGGGLGTAHHPEVEALLLTAAAANGVPVPRVVATGDDGLPPGWLVVERLDGETIPRKLLRDHEWEAARRLLTRQCGRALAAVHRIPPAEVPGLAPEDPLHDPLPLLDGLGEHRPVLELGVRWLDLHRPEPGRRVTVHGDFRMGNLLVGPDGLRAVLDWELAHVGDPAEDIGWLCAPAWRFGGAHPVGGVGDLPELLDAYAAAGGEPVSADRVRWWQVYATCKWALICVLQASAHLTGATRSVELAAIGRRVCESEWDLLGLLGLRSDLRPPVEPPAPGPTPPFGRPTAAELVEAVREHLEREGSRGAEGRARFDTRIAVNVLATVARELQVGPPLAEAHRVRLADLGFDDDAALARALRSTALDDRLYAVGRVLASSARDQLLVANPGYLEAPAGDTASADAASKNPSSS